MKKFYITFLLVFSHLCIAQVGINYNPNGTEDAALLIRSLDNKSIGRLNNGQEIKPGMVLVSDVNGTATWKDANMLKMPTINGVWGQPINRDLTRPLNTSRPSPTFVSNSYIELPPGEWAITLQMNIELVLISRNNTSQEYIETKFNRGQSAWIRTSLAESHLTEANQAELGPTEDFRLTNLSSGEMIGNEYEITTKGEMFILNNTNANKRYNLIVYLEFHAPVNYSNNLQGVRLKNFGGGPQLNGVDRFYAIKYR